LLQFVGVLWDNTGCESEMLQFVGVLLQFVGVLWDNTGCESEVLQFVGVLLQFVGVLWDNTGCESEMLQFVGVLCLCVYACARVMCDTTLTFMSLDILLPVTHALYAC